MSSNNKFKSWRKKTLNWNRVLNQRKRQNYYALNLKSAVKSLRCIKSGHLILQSLSIFNQQGSPTFASKKRRWRDSMRQKSLNWSLKTRRCSRRIQRWLYKWPHRRSNIRPALPTSSLSWISCSRCLYCHYSSPKWESLKVQLYKLRGKSA